MKTTDKEALAEKTCLALMPGDTAQVDAEGCDFYIIISVVAGCDVLREFQLFHKETRAAFVIFGTPRVSQNYLLHAKALLAAAQSFTANLTEFDHEKN